jgi:hypothetical protein
MPLPNNVFEFLGSPFSGQNLITHTRGTPAIFR